MIEIKEKTVTGKTIHLHDADNVVIARIDLALVAKIEGGLTCRGHDTGCGMEMTGEPMDLLRRTMAGYARHANLAGSMIVGLGCERNQIKGLMKEQKLDAGDRLHHFTMQDTGGTRKTIEAGGRIS